KNVQNDLGRHASGWRARGTDSARAPVPAGHRFESGRLERSGRSQEKVSVRERAGRSGIGERPRESDDHAVRRGRAGNHVEEAGLHLLNRRRTGSGTSCKSPTESIVAAFAKPVTWKTEKSKRQPRLPEFLTAHCGGYEAMPSGLAFRGNTGTDGTFPRKCGAKMSRQSPYCSVG